MYLYYLRVNRTYLYTSIYVNRRNEGNVCREIASLDIEFISHKGTMKDIKADKAATVEGRQGISYRMIKVLVYMPAYLALFQSISSRFHVNDATRVFYD